MKVVREALSANIGGAWVGVNLPSLTTKDTKPHEANAETKTFVTNRVVHGSLLFLFHVAHALKQAG
jgi:hypothetical protein